MHSLLTLTLAAAAATADDITVACYYFPNYHVDPRNEAQHGPGWTEWELVKDAEPRWEGHHQPRVPTWGYTDEADPKAMAQKIDAAADHAIDAFIFDWYYYDDGPFLERGIEKGFFGAENNNRLKFGIMWANHDWTDIHPAKRHVQPTLQFPGKITPETWERMTSFLVDTYFKHPSYWMIDGKPYFSVYDLTTLLASFGSLEATRAALDAFRAKCIEADLPGLHLNIVVWGRAILPGEQAPTEPAVLVEALGFDSVTSYVWIHHVALDVFPQTDYCEVQAKYLAFVDKHAGPCRFPISRTSRWGGTRARARCNPTSSTRGAIPSWRQWGTTRPSTSRRPAAPCGRGLTRMLAARALSPSTAGTSGPRAATSSPTRSTAWPISKSWGMCFVERTLQRSVEWRGHCSPCPSAKSGLSEITPTLVLVNGPRHNQHRRSSEPPTNRLSA
ncbi:MAG TPA: hypothetical protein ENN80_11845 [Candidatus Hydrogenedentes bacterium]|nr:hypothetical protein [Candidatus Hydrogenedentota bacterium]